MTRLERIDIEYTAENKDKLLAYLIENTKPSACYSTLKANEISVELGICVEFIDCFLREFHDLGLVEYKGFSTGNNFSLTVTHNSIAFRTKGGFCFQEALFINKLTLLQSQIKALESDVPVDKLKNLLDISSNLITVYTAFFGAR